MSKNITQCSVKVKVSLGKPCVDLILNLFNYIVCIIKGLSMDTHVI